MKFFITLISFLVLASQVEAKIKAEGIEIKYCPSVVAVAIDPTNDGGTVTYVNLVDNTSGTTEANDDMYTVPVALYAHSLRVLTPTAPGAGNDPWTIVLRDDGADTGLSCTIDETATNCTDTESFVELAAGSKVTVSISATGSDANPTDTAELAVSFCTNQQ